MCIFLMSVDFAANISGCGLKRTVVYVPLFPKSYDVEISRFLRKQFCDNLQDGEGTQLRHLY